MNCPTKADPLARRVLQSVIVFRNRFRRDPLISEIAQSMAERRILQSRDAAQRIARIVMASPHLDYTPPARGAQSMRDDVCNWTIEVVSETQALAALSGPAAV